MLERSDPNTQHPTPNALAIIDRQVRQMARLVDDLLDVSRITQGRVELRKERIDLTVVVRSAVETSRPLIEARAHVLSLSLPPDPIWLEADPARLEQILTNLLNNAAKYTDPGGRISLTLGVESENDFTTETRRHGEGTDTTELGREVRLPQADSPPPHSPSPSVPLCLRGDFRWAAITVRDTGVGLAPDLLPRVFDLFTQADRSLDRAQGGLGIGLTLVRRLTELHGGSVHAHSDGPGQGSEFVVRLPVTADANRQPSDASPTKAGRADATGGHSNDWRLTAGVSKRVLVVDDNADAAATLADLLDDWGHQVRIAHDGRLALEEASHYQPEVVLLDIGLPQMDGYEVARRLGEQAWRSTMRLVAVTGYGQEEDRRKALAAGFDDYLVKPVDPDTLQRLLAEARV